MYHHSYPSGTTVLGTVDSKVQWVNNLFTIYTILSLTIVYVSKIILINYKSLSCSIQLGDLKYSGMVSSMRAMIL